ncbi:MAG: hypothetical protein GF346_04180 [Candidatus Eisenbacteria bacterium]|nr:hypothetical protein [Candidatus Latescibacterota bacterium]MBD3301624.1 hypothetical protein [Candidatus Eisenbacteria bacterium]
MRCIRAFRGGPRPGLPLVPSPLIAVLLAGVAATMSLAGDLLSHGVTAGEVVSESTFRCIGVQWFIAGDDDLDAEVAVEYRRLGEPAWCDAQPLLRVEPGSYNEDGVDPGNLLAGSVFGLLPDTEYEIRLALSDPDGGGAVETVVVRTRAEPSDPLHPRVRHVVPGSGGGSGTEGDPFRGIEAADAAAAPGDVFVLGAGVYSGGDDLTASGTPEDPIVWRGIDVDLVILDGEWSADPILEASGTAHVRVEQVTFVRPRRTAVRAYGTTGLAIRGCIVDVTQDNGYEMGGIHILGSENRDVLIEDNVILGHMIWEEGRIDDGYALRVMGKGHVVRHNRIDGWFDGVNVGVDDESVETSNCDVYGNEILNCTDDGIETDASRHNIRVFENRITNTLVGLSAQPVYGGPIYFIRNVVYNWQLKPLKFHIWPTGILVYHNTFVGADTRGWGGGEWRNVALRNNLIIGGSHSGPTGNPICIDTEGVRADLDSNGWYQADPEAFAYFNGRFHPTLEDFQDETGMSLQAKLVDVGIFEDAEEPPLGSYLGREGFPPAYAPGSQDLRLRGGCNAADAGELLANINDDYTGGAAELGAYECGVAMPHYGPTAGIPAFVVEHRNPAGPLLLGASAPNPFRYRTRLSYELDRSAIVGASVHDAQGRCVQTVLARAERRPGVYELSWDGRDGEGRPVAAGVYWWRIAAGDRTGARRILLLR